MCRQLLHRRNVSGVVRPGAFFGPGAGQIWLDDVRCPASVRDGADPRLELCYHSDWGQVDCTHNEDVSVTCGDNPRAPGQRLPACLPTCLPAAGARRVAAARLACLPPAPPPPSCAKAIVPAGSRHMPLPAMVPRCLLGARVPAPDATPTQPCCWRSHGAAQGRPQLSGGAPRGAAR